jgi:capsular exopolysaccharide synthesis family protein
MGKTYRSEPRGGGSGRTGAVIDVSDVDREEGSLRESLAVVRRRKWLIAAITIACGAAALAFSLLQDTVYQAETNVVVGQGNSLFQPGEANAVQPFTLTFGELVRTNVVAAQVIQNLGLDETPAHLLERIGVGINPDTAVLRITCRDTDSNRAVAICGQFAKVFSDEVREQFGSTPAAGEGPPPTATIFDPAHANPIPVAPSPVRNTAVALVLGFILGLVASFLREYLDRRLRTREDVEAAYGVPVIGQIPFLRLRKDERRVVWDERGEVPEAFRGLRANLQYLGVERPLRTILITSATPEQGKTTVAANLAVAIARGGANVAVLEGDLRRPRVDGAFALPRGAPGLTSVLVGATDLEDAQQVVDPSRSELAGRLSVVGSGPLPPNPSELLASFGMRDLLDQLAHGNDVVLVDSPPLLLVADGLELARMADGVIVTVRRNRASRDEARELRAVVERLGIHLIGVVLTDVPVSSGYGYGEPYGERRDSGRRRAAAREPAATAPLDDF